MAGLAFLSIFGLLPALGAAAVALPTARSLDLGGRVAVAAATGAVALCLEMLLVSAIGLRWSLPLLLGPLLVLGAAGAILRGRRPARRPAGGTGFLWLSLTLLAVVLLAYVAGSARATSPDFLLFWGTKGERFALARAIDTVFLAAPEHRLMHPDYPPLLPLLYACGALAAGRFPWGAALLTLPVWVLFTALGFRGWARPALGARSAARFTAVLAALLGFVLSVTWSAGNGEPPLLFFESMALAAAVFGAADRSVDVLLSVALAGAVLTKFEGLVFAAILAAGVVLLRRRRGERLGSSLRLGALPLVSLGAWILFCDRHGLLDAYKGGAAGPFNLRLLRPVVGTVAASLDYGLVYLPWILLVLLWAGGPGRRGGLLPAAVGVSVAVTNVYFYLHGTANPTLWIQWSACRTFLTPLLCLFFASAAASRGKESPADRVTMVLEE